MSANCIRISTNEWARLKQILPSGIRKKNLVCAKLTLPTVVQPRPTMQKVPNASARSAFARALSEVVRVPLLTAFETLSAGVD
jgi:hypothetical protein